MVVGDTGLILYLDSKFPDPFYGYFFVVLFTAINREQHIDDQTAKYLNHEAILTSVNQMVDSEVSFPPSKEFFYVPSEFVNKSGLFCINLYKVFVGNGQG